jgi:MFS family permease
MNNSIVIGEDKMPIVSSPASLHKQSLEVCQQETLECTQQQQPAVVVTRGHFFLIMASLWIGNFTAYFNETTATTAMHIIAADFNNLANQNWIATSYLLGFTVTQTLLGRFADIFGRAQVFNGTMLIFGAGTLWCGLATNMNSLIGARLLQGIGAAGRQSVGVIIILDLTTADSRGLWLGFFNCASAIGLAIGPVLGAVLSVDADWRWIFWITLMLIGVTLAIGTTCLRYPVPHRKQRIGLLAQLGEVDYIGSVLAVAVSSMICIAIEMGNKLFPWNVGTWLHKYFVLTYTAFPSRHLSLLCSSLEVSSYLSLFSTSSR